MAALGPEVDVSREEDAHGPVDMAAKGPVFGVDAARPVESVPSFGR